MPCLSISAKLRIETSIKNIEDEHLERHMTSAESACYENAKKIKETFTIKVMGTDYPVNTYEKLQRHLLKVSNELSNLVCILRKRSYK